jgi:hypothetical protein
MCPRVLALFFIFVAAILLLNFHFWASRMLWFYFLSLATGFVFIISKNPFERRDPSEMDNKRLLLVLAGFVLLFYYPVGSDVGIFSAGTPAVWLAFPVASGLLPTFFDGGIRVKLANKNTTFAVNLQESKIVAGLLIFAVAFWAVELKKSASSAYNDPGYFYNKRECVESPLAKNIFVNERLGRNINGAVTEIKKYARTGDFLFCYDSVPLLNYLTRTRSYAGNAWPWVYPADVLEKKFADHVSASELPRAIVIQKIKRSLNGGSPFEPFPNYFNPAGTSDLFSAKRAAVVKKFMTTHNYRRVWNNEYFEVHVPAPRTSALSKSKQ